MQSAFVNTGLEPIQFLVFIGAVGLVLAVLRGLPFVNVLSFFQWLFSYPVLSLLALGGVLIAFGLFGRDYGLEYCLYPDENLKKFAAAALLMVLFCETLALSYLRDHVDYERSPTARARANSTLIRTWNILDQWTIVRWLITRLSKTGDDVWLRYLGKDDVEAHGRSLADPIKSLTDSPVRRLKATVAVVATHGTLLMGLIAIVVVLAVTKENWGHLGHQGNRSRIGTDLEWYLSGLPVGLLVSVGLTALVVVFIPGASEESPVSLEDLTRKPPLWPASRLTDAALCLMALAYLALAYVYPSICFWFNLSILMVVLAWLIRQWLLRCDTDSPSPRQGYTSVVSKFATSSVASMTPRVIYRALDRTGAITRPHAYAISMVMTYLLSCVAMSFKRTWGGARDSGDWAFVIGLMLSLAVTALFLFRTRLRTPDSIVAVPALMLQGFLGISIVYMFGGRTWWIFSEVVALAMTCLIGGTVALFFFISYLLPGRLAAGVMACLLLTAYMDGLAIDQVDSNHKLRYSDLSEYYHDPVILDTRDYFTSSYGKVLRLDHKPNVQSTPNSRRIGSGLFEIVGNDIVVEPPGDLLRHDGRPVVIRMPRQVPIEYKANPPRLVLGGVGRKNLKNAAILWKNPNSPFNRTRDKEQPRQEAGARYAVFPLWPEDVARNPRDRTLYWLYRPENSNETEWTVKIPEGSNWQQYIGKKEDFFLVGNWYFEVKKSDPPRGGMDNGIKSTRYRIRGAASNDYFPDLWWRQDANSRTLGLRMPGPTEANEGADLQVTLTVPVPLGDYRVLKSEPGDDPEAVRVLISMPAEGMEPRPGNVVSFSPGGVIHGPYAIEECRRVAPVISDADGVDGLRASEPRPASVLLLRKNIEIERGAPTASQPRPEPVSENDARKKKADVVDTWEVQETNGATSADRLLDNIQVLQNWKNALDSLPEKTGRRVTCRMCPVQHSVTCRHQGQNPPAQGDPLCDCPTMHKLILVTVSGGGIRSAVWAATVLSSLEASFGPAFPYHIRIISGASGGMVGATYYTGTIRDPASLSNDPPGAVNPHNVPGELDKLLGECDFLSPTASQMVFSDLPRGLTLPLSLEEDRGRALEQSWEEKLVKGKDVFGQPFCGPKGFAKDEKEGWRPSLIFTPMLVEDGRRLIISNLDLAFAPLNIGAMMLDQDSSLLRPQINQFGAFVDGGILPGFDLYSLTAVEFFRLFPDATKFRVGTAARMSATFPVISPAVTLPTLPPRSVVDAGYYDNFGINLVSLWADLGNIKQWLVENTSGVLILQIRDHASQLLRTELDYDVRAVGNPVTEFLMGPDVATVTGDAVHAMYDRGLLQLARPLNGFFSSRYAVTSFRNDEQIESLNNFLRNVPPTATELRDGVRQALQDALAKQSVPSAAATVTPENLRAELVKQFECNLSLLKLEGRPFPYTTAVFECPIEAALSWDLTASESYCIRKGMGPPPDSSGTLDSRDYLVRDGLLCQIRNDYSKHGQDLQMAGRQLDRVCFNVLHNQQRLGFLKRWCLRSRYGPFHRPPVATSSAGRIGLTTP